MNTVPLGIIINGATGGIASRAHLANALMPIIREGGLAVGDKIVVPELLLVARNPEKLAKVAAKFGIERYTTDLGAALADPDFSVLFDAGHTGTRADVLRAALAAGKHVYSEKPVATDRAVGMELLSLTRATGLRFGVVEDKLFLPGMMKLRHLAQSGFFGEITNFRLSFGFWFFDGYDQPDQRARWNYEIVNGGGLALDTYPHWRYVIEGILGPISSLVARCWTGVPNRRDSSGQEYVADADDSSATIVELACGAVGTVGSSVAARVRGDDLITFQVDGTKGSAVAGLHRCHIQPGSATPQVAFNPAIDLGKDYRADWDSVADTGPVQNGFRMGWEAFIRHVVGGEPLIADLAAGLRDVAFAHAVYASSAERRWVNIDDFLP